MTTQHTGVSLFLTDLLDPARHDRVDIDGAAVTLDPIEEAAFDVVLDVAARITEPEDWKVLVARSREPGFWSAFEAICLAQADEAQRIGGGRYGR